MRAPGPPDPPTPQARHKHRRRQESCAEIAAHLHVFETHAQPELQQRLLLANNVLVVQRRGCHAPRGGRDERVVRAREVLELLGTAAAAEDGLDLFENSLAFFDLVFREATQGRVRAVPVVFPGRLNQLVLAAVLDKVGAVLPRVLIIAKSRQARVQGWRVSL